MTKGEYLIQTSSSSQDYSGSFVMCCYVLHQVIAVYGSGNSQGNITAMSVKFFFLQEEIEIQNNIVSE